jgi:hypothetical protein
LINGIDKSKVAYIKKQKYLTNICKKEQENQPEILKNKRKHAKDEKRKNVR